MTPLAYEVVMWIDICVESVKCAAKIDLSSQALLDEDIQIPIDGAHAESGKLFSQLIV